MLQEIRDLLQYFSYDHLPDHLKAVSEPFCLLAEKMAHDAPESNQTLLGLQWLLLAKDCAVRAQVSK